MIENAEVEITPLPLPEDISLEKLEEIKDSPLGRALMRWLSDDPDECEEAASSFTNYV